MASNSKAWKQNDIAAGSGSGSSRVEEETNNSLAIVPSTGSPEPVSVEVVSGREEVVSGREVEWKISAWETEEMAKIHSRFKRVEAVINRWEEQQTEKATACFRKVERKLEEERARALERMQNDVARARREVEEKISSVEAKLGEKLSKVLETVKLMKIVGRPPSKRSFF